MKKLLNVLVITLGICTLFSCTINKPESEKRTITVWGKGQVWAAADMVELIFSVKSTDWNVNTASQKNTENTNNAITAIKELGIGQEDICTYNLKVTQDNSNSYPGKYTVSNEISVKIRNIENAEKVINAAVKNTAANGITDFKYILSDKNTAIRQARNLAVQDAQNAASLLTGASGCKVDSVLNIVEEKINIVNEENLHSKMSSKENTSINQGSILIESEVLITYSLIN